MELFKVFGSVFIKDDASKQLADLDKKGKSLGERMGKLGKTFENVGKKMSTFITLPIIGAGVGIAKAGMDFEATGAKFETVFEGMTEQADEFLDKFQKLTPATRTEARSMASGLQDLLVPMGFARDEATRLTGEMMHAVGALTNFNSATHDADRVTQAMTSALLGSYDSLASLGIQLDVNTVKQKAVEMGLANSTDEVTKQQQALVMIQEVYNQSGDALEAYTEENLDALTKMGLLKAEVIDVAASFGEHLLPIITVAIEFIRDVTERFGNLSQEQQQTIIIVGAVVAALGPLVFIIGKVITLLPILKAGFLFLTGPIGVVTAAVGLLTAAIIYLWKTNETFRNIVLVIWAEIKNFISVTIGFISVVIKTTIDFIRELWELWGEDISSIARKYWELISVLISAAIGFISYVIKTTIGFIKELWELWGEDILSIAKKYWELISVLIGYVLDGIKWVVDGVVNDIMYIWNTFGDYILTYITLKFDLMMVYVKTVFETIKGIISQALKIINGVFDVFIGVLTGDWGRMWDGMKSVAKGAANMIIGIFNGVIAGAEGMINAVSRAINSLPTFKIPDWVPRVGGRRFRLPKMPSLNIPKIPKIDGSHENGLDYVPFDGYVAELHKGERVLTASENKRGAGTTINITGNTILNDRDADRFGDMLVNRLRVLGVT